MLCPYAKSIERGDCISVQGTAIKNSEVWQIPQRKSSVVTYHRPAVVVPERSV
jgi:hypothetical protein